MNFSPATQKAIIRREREIAALEELWTKLCRLRGEKVSFRQFDLEIMKRFNTSSGRDCLSFESIEKVRLNLEASIVMEQKQNRLAFV